jgi:hypothetical protein
MTFTEYLRFALTHTAFTMNHSIGDPIVLGAWGYVYAGLLILGFACGGYLMFNLTRSAPYCEACNLYMQKQGGQTRYFVKREDMTECFAGFKAEAAGGGFRQAVETHARAGQREADATTGYSLVVEFKHCKRCGQQWLEFVAKQRVNHSWNGMSEFKYSSYCGERIDAMEVLAGA